VKNLFNFAVSKDARTVVYEHSTASTPTQWFKATLEGNRLANEVKITDLNPAFKNKAGAKTEVVRWKGALGEEIDGILYYPKDYEPGKQYPLLTAPHGGPAGADLDSWEESWAYAHQLLSQRGTSILKPNYHGSSNYGLKFVESICCGHYYDYPVEDIEKGVDFLVAKGLVDPDKVGTRYGPEAKVEELGSGAPLLKEAGSFAGAGKNDEPLVFYLGSNVAEWVMGKDGGAKKMGGSADRPADPRAQSWSAAMEYTGFRVVRGEAKAKS
jgi:hypothetical protein